MTPLYYPGQTHDEFEETRRRINLWLLCELAPETAIKWMEKQREEKR